MRVLRSAGVRLALAYGGLFGISALALVLFLWWAITALLTNQVDAAIRADAQGLAERWQDGGPAALLATIQSRLAANVDPDAIYLVLDPSGRSVVGNLGSWPAEVQSVGSTYEIAVQREGHTSLARLHRFELPGGYALLVGRDVQARVALRGLLTETLAWALLLGAALGTLGGLAVRRLFRRMLGGVAATAAAIHSGDLGQRVRLSGRGDEFDQVAAGINDMLDRIAILMDGVRQVGNAIAHDLRTPITRARARLEDAATHSASAADLQAAVERAVTDLDGITTIFQALLRIAEVEAGARRSAFAAVDAAPLLAGMAELYGAAAEEHGLRLTLQAPEALPLHGDAELIGQAVANLLDNAIKFSPPGGAVTLAGERAGAAVQVTVTDTGPGILPADHVRAAERFFRGEAARHTPGFGLGLTLVQAVAHLHGGTLALADNAPGLRAVLTLGTSSPPGISLTHQAAPIHQAAYKASSHG